MPAPRLIPDPGPHQAPATRAEGLRRLHGFVPAMGRYAAERNHDRGPDDRANVSGLSPWLRRRLVSEAEVLDAGLARFAPSTLEKFTQEVLWRTYFKGWLEQRPQVWDDYRDGLARDLKAVAGNPGLRRALTRAEAGDTGLAPFDAWARELAETGYLHNHARMWTASIWIFTLRLPWRLGAAWFLRHLLDGDPAANTCSWRWVAGLHTPGKHYVARASNITKFTGGRFGAVHGLAADPAPLDEGPLPPLRPLRQAPAPDFARPTALLLLEDDLTLETQLPVARAVAAAVLPLSPLRVPEPASGPTAFEAAALSDAAARAHAAGAPEAQVLSPDPAALVAWAQAAGAREIATGFVPTGWARDWLDRRARPALDAAGLRLTEHRRDWDAAIWPLATAGYFKVKDKAPAALRGLGLPL